jgi:hypothetical protein
MILQDTLRAIAEEAPPYLVPEKLFDKARRRHRRRVQWSAVAVVLLVLATGYGLTPPDVRGAEPAAGPPGLPSQLFAPERWTEAFADSPTGPASVAFSGPALADKAFSNGFDGFTSPVGLVGLTRDTYRVVYPSQGGSLALSPDGQTMLLPYLKGPAGDLASKNWRTDALDLTTGSIRTVATGVIPIAWAPDGRHALLAKWNRWDNQAGPAESINDITVSVMAWPSTHIDWTVYISRPEAVEGESNFYVALSPDATRVAVSTSKQLRVYRSDATVVWRRDVGWSMFAGPAAWRDDNRLAVLRRTLPNCADCQLEHFYDPSDWTMTFVDASTGAPADGPRYPVLGAANSLQVVAWRGDTAYAESRSELDSHGTTQAHFLRLTADAPAAEQVISVPRGISALAVAVDYVDRIRAVGTPAFGFSVPQVLALGLSIARWLVLAGLVALAVWWRRRRRRKRVQALRASMDG